MIDFGTDMSCLDEIDPRRVVSGVEAVAQNAWRCLITRRGQLLDSPLFGCGEVLSLGKRIDRRTVAQMRAQIGAALRRDERILWATVEITEGSGNLWTMAIQAKTASGPFRLVVAVDGVTPQLLGIES